jgi:beta-mannosidase
MKDYVKHFGAPTARFAPETPALGMPCLSSMRKFMTDDMIFSDDVTVLKYHMKNHPGREFAAFDYFDTIKTMAEKIFGGFTDHHDRIRKMILVQYEWIRAATEAFRRRTFYSGGLLYWMFNDCWPALGWSLVDYYCVPKSGWYALKRAGANVSASLEALEDGGVAAWICNCGMSEAKCSVRISLQPFDRQEAIREWRGEFTNRGNISKAVLKIKPDEITELANGTCVMVFDLEYETEHEHFTDRTFYSPLLFREWKMPAATVTVTRNGGETGGSLDVSTDLYAHGISLDGQYVFSDNYFNLNPGETRTIDYRAAYQSEGGPIGTAWLNMK